MLSVSVQIPEYHPAVIKMMFAGASDRSQQDLARFKLEYDIVSRLKHPSVVEIYGYGTAGEHAYIAMEYFPDDSLRSRMRKGMTLDDAVTCSRQRGREV